MKHMMKSFVDNTTLHGLRYVVLSPTKIRQLVWLLLLLGSTVMYLFLVQQSVTKYNSNPFVTENMEVIPEDGSLKFPAVTICNLNHFVKSKINLHESNENFYKLGLNMSVCRVVGDVKTGLTCGQALLCAFEKFGTAVVENCSETTKQHLVNALNTTQEPVFNPEEFLATYGHEISAMFLYYCRFAVRENCVPADFLPTLTERGLCYTFNSGRNGSRVRSTRLTGSEGGLSIILDVQSDENTISEFSRGFRVILHEQGAFVNFDEGFNVYPGSHALVTVTAKQHQRLPAPYSSACVQFSLPRIANYTKDGCLKQCQTNSTITLCGCRKRGVPVLSDVPVCTFQHEYCYQESLSKFNHRGCSCGVSCKETNYVPQISYSNFPDLAVSNILHYKFSYERTVEYQRTNLVFLQIGFKYVAYQYYLETPSYGLDSLLGDVGGNMGLFLGCSLLTVLEFMDLAWSLLKNVAKVRSVEDEEMEGTV